MDAEEKWAAVLANDARYDGRFFYGVKRTGIYCRPSCKSKKPSSKNVRFFDCAQEAELAGFRPCKRCRPDVFAYNPAAKIAEAAKAIIDETFSDRIELREKLHAIGVSRRHLTERFEKRYEMSLEQYVHQVRFSRAKEMLTEGKQITDVAFAVGMQSPSAFTVFFKKQAGMSPSEYRAKQATESPYCFCQTPIGRLRIVENEKGIAGIRFVDQQPAAKAPTAKGTYLADATEQLQAYFAKRSTAFDVPLCPLGSKFQQSVWRELQNIPYGETRSYQDIARRIGNPKAARAVGMANNRNPILIMIPCHRVVGKDNRLVGYAGGIERKQYLLHLEDANDPSDIAKYRH